MPNPKPTQAPIAQALRDFVKLESAAGLLLLATAIIALLIANSPLSGLHTALLDTPVAVSVGSHAIDKPLLLWINDGLMAVFFFLVGLEIKREVMEGELSSMAQIALPGLGALGGMLVPAAVYMALNVGDSLALDGWAIPVATDIAFALALLGIFGSRVPPSLKIFLLTLAIFDDLAAIVIIALFYSGDLSTTALYFALGALVLAAGMNRFGITRLSYYVMVGIVLWVSLLKSGVHATLAGVLIAFCVPMRDASGASPLRRLEHDLHSPVAYLVLPLFAFANAGLSLAEMSIDDLATPVTLGVILGLLVGKPIGVMLFVGLGVLLRFAQLPAGTNWWQILGVGFACGIGFTMSLFIA
ncbi:MAG: Na+/H+ antiporter NhaA, partial [Pseudomonadota bacterium]